MCVLCVCFVCVCFLCVCVYSPDKAQQKLRPLHSRTCLLHFRALLECGWEATMGQVGGSKWAFLSRLVGRQGGAS